MDANWGWAAGAGFMFLAWVAYVRLFPTEEKKRDWCMKRLWEGKDRRASFSKFQFWLWTLVVVFAVLSIAIARAIASEGILESVDEIPDNVLGVLGISVFTATGAKVRTTLFVDRRLTTKRVKKKQDTTTPLQELVADDAGVPELAKIQMLLFTLVAVIIFLVTTAEAINSGEENNMVLPDIDRALLILMGISSAGYLGKKAITLDRPKITSITPGEVPADRKTRIMLTGTSLGNKGNGVLTVGKRSYKTEPQKAEIDEWSDTLISFDFDPALPEFKAGETYDVCVIVGDLESEPKKLEVEAPKITAIMPSEVPAGQMTPVILTGRALGDKKIGILSVGQRVYKKDDHKKTMQWSGSAISLDFDPRENKKWKHPELKPGNYTVEVTVGDAKSEPVFLRVAPGEIVSPEESGKPEGDND